MKLIKSDDGLWKFLDMPDTPFWYALFHTEEDALKALEIFISQRNEAYFLLDKMSAVLQRYMNDAGIRSEIILERYEAFKIVNRGHAVESSSDGCTNRGHAVESSSDGCTNRG